MLGGLRHLVWDIGLGLGKAARDRMALATIIGSLGAHRCPVGRRTGGALMAENHMAHAARSRVLGLGSAHDGTVQFWRQRLTAMANVPLTIAFVVLVVAMVGRPQADVAAILASPLVAVILAPDGRSRSRSICGSACR